MSRLPRALKWLFDSPRIFRRMPSGTSTLHMPGGQTVILHKVKFDKRRSVAKRINRLFFGGVSLFIVGSILLDAEIIRDAFIPFPLTTRRLDPQPYAGSDPEWREFIRIAKDKALQAKIRQDLVGLVMHHAKTSRILAQRCGSDMKIRRYWMDLDFPYVAPPEYEISGLLFTEDAIEWTARPIESITVKTLERVLWPSPMALSFWTLGAAVVKQKTAEIARYFGLETNGSAQPGTPGSPSPLPTSPSPQMQKALERMRQQATKRPDAEDPSSMARNTAPSPAGKPPGAAEKVPTGSENTQAPSQKFWGEEKVRTAVSLSPWQVFMKKYAQSWRPIRPDPPRGCIAVSGLVELETSKSWVVIDVFGWYNPKTKSYDPKSMWMGVRRLQHRQQSPLR